MEAVIQRVIEDLDPTNKRKGENGVPFYIKLSKWEGEDPFDLTEIITYDRQRGLELYINPDHPIVEVSDGVILTVQMLNSDVFHFFDNKFLTPGTNYFRVGTTRYSYGGKPTTV